MFRKLVFTKGWLGVLVVSIAAMPGMASPELNTSAVTIIRAQSLNAQGMQQLEIGNAAAALETWKQAEAAYTAAGDETGKLGSVLNQVQALQTLGHYRQAKTVLEQLNTRLQTLPDSPLKASSLQSLGVTLFRVGDVKAAQTVLQDSLSIAQQLNVDTSGTLLALGNVARSLQQNENDKGNQSTDTTAQAIAYYQQAAAATPDRLTRLQARLNLFSFLVEADQSAQALLLFPEIQALLADLPPSRATVYAQVNLAESLMKIGEREIKDVQVNPNQTKIPIRSSVAQLLAKAIQQARSLQDARAEAYALGQLGHLYERSQQWAEAQSLTQQALEVAQAIQAEDIAVSWHWQLGRILRQQGRTPDAIAAYNQAVDTLSILRGDLVAMNPDVQFSFREQVEPIYRQLVQLLLADPTQANLQRGRTVIEALQLAELNNFFRQACLDAQPQQVDQIDPNAAVVYSIILPDRLAVILSLPGQPLRYRSTSLAATSGDASNNPVDLVVEDLFATLNPFVSSPEPLRSNQQLYNWLIHPLEADLAKSQVKTLVFVMDGVLRGVPIAALHDGQQYLIEKYSLALTPGLQLLPPQSLSPQQLQALAGGVSESRQGFAALPGVAQEMQQIATKVPTSILLNQTFTQKQLHGKLEASPFPIVHLATHGQFSSQAENTFLLTWDGRINVKDFDQLLEVRDRSDRNPIELLILSACQTAAGDKRAALGLAGVAVRSGARSTIATLWSVQDESTTELMSRLYAALKQPNMTRSEALRQAQLTLLRSSNYQHPYYWAPFVLIGNWR